MSSPNEPDNRILECAMVNHARWMVTWDRQRLKLGRYGGTQIVAVRAMHEFIAGSPSNRGK
jgi:predicted nucleic acid-binding protein